MFIYKLNTAFCSLQAALPQGIVPFVFAKEYNIYPDILSTGQEFPFILLILHVIIFFPWFNMILKSSFFFFWLQGYFWHANCLAHSIGLLLHVSTVKSLPQLSNITLGPEENFLQHNWRTRNMVRMLQQMDLGVSFNLFISFEMM